MQTFKTPDLKKIINNALVNAISYQDYRILVKGLVENETTSGNEKTEVLANYTMLNDRRMKRWDKTIKIPEGLQNSISKLQVDQTWLVLTESWCGDAAHIMPVINKITDLNQGIDFKVVLRDENEALMNAFLTNGGQAIPKLLMIDKNSKIVKNTFGPRPKEATALVNNHKAKHGTVLPEFKEELQQWYNKDKGGNTIHDIVNLMQENQDM